jgi:hypothetical protein
MSLGNTDLGTPDIPGSILCVDGKHTHSTPCNGDSGGMLEFMFFDIYIC